MQSKLLVATLSAAALAPFASGEQVLGVYIFHRHGDRTSKSWNPVSLTPLGADQVFSSGSFFRNRYIASDAALRIANVSADAAVLSQLAFTAPVDNVLHNSANVFTQALYPPSAGAGSQTLANGTKVEAPLGGYQYIPVNAVANSASSASSESSEWLQGGSGCSDAVVSSNNYFSSPEYLTTFNATKSFYQGLLPVINTTFNASTATFKNGYTIFDYINVAEIHNSSIPSKDLLTNAALTNLYDLASTHEWNLAYNSSDPVRAIAGSVLAGQILSSLSDIASGKAGVPRVNVQFGAYAAFMSFFGLAQLQNVSNDFHGIVDYASAMVFELVAPSATDLKTDDLAVRFLFTNGTAAQHNLTTFPLFGQKETTLSWNDFKNGMTQFAVSDTNHWCQLCGNTDGTCANTTSSGSGSGSGSGTASPSSSSGGDSGGVSRPVAGVIGALVTLAVILGLEAAIMLLGGLRLAKKSTLAAAGSAGTTTSAIKA